ncbi:hypothetical protein FB566_3840 [Stackebrandtia endophytica]|uniref:Uncharacterized protein n=1 Tax=Stackebrandtia endophytica TaxID=1496996 RepID=A0A543B092_9ACTN|nr:permease prefix domain 1-containing protein [Stackebrandtia endophytica]TQL78257.1 hypothetical protein FB566_3840 [Stackebrandtia endophytica]
MNPTVERYLERAVSGVAVSDRADAARELRGAIEDDVHDRMDAGLTEDAAVTTVLEDFGDPLDIAARYRSTPLGLISSARYSAWRTLVRLLLGIVVPLVAGTILIIEIDQGASLAGLLWAVTVAVVETVVHVTFWTTLVFVGVDRWAPPPTKTTVPWSVAYLPQVSTGPQVGPIEAILWAGSALLGIAFVVGQRFVSPLSDSEGPIPILAPSEWDLWWPVVIGVLAATAVTAILVGVRGRWTTGLIHVTVALNLALAVPVLWLLGSGRALNPAFTDSLGPAVADLGWDMGATPGDALTAVLIVLVSVSLVWELASAAAQSHRVRLKKIDNEWKDENR